MMEHKIDTPRSSERIKSQQSRVFQMPDREQVFKKIKTTASPGNTHDHLRPRRLVNNFTRENHRYNFDPAYTDESSGDEDFIDDGSEEAENSSHSEVESNNSDVEGSGNDHGFHLRSRNGGVLESDSDDSSTSGMNSSKIQHNSIIESDSDSSNHIEPKEIVDNESKDKDCLLLEKDHMQQDSADSEDEIISPKPRSKTKKVKSVSKRQIIAGSSSESDSESPVKSKRRACLGSANSSSSNDEDFERLYSSNEEMDERLPSDRAIIMESKKQHRRNLLQELQAKRNTNKLVKTDGERD